MNSEGMKHLFMWSETKTIVNLLNDKFNGNSYQDGAQHFLRNNNSNKKKDFFFVNKIRYSIHWIWLLSMRYIEYIESSIKPNQTNVYKIKGS